MKAIVQQMILICFYVSRNMFAQDKPVKFPSTHIKGRIMYDNAIFHESEPLRTKFTDDQISVGSEFRRLFLAFSGDVSKNVAYKLQLNFVGDKVGLRDVYIGIKDLPVVGEVRVGQVKEPISLDVLNSSLYTTFLERSLVASLFPIRNSGLLLKNDIFKNKLSYQLGFFHQQVEDYKKGTEAQLQNGHVIDARVSTLLCHQDNFFIHTGTAYSYRNNNHKDYQFSVMPEVNLSNIQYLKNTISNTKNVQLYNFEIASSYKWMHLQSEIMVTKIATISQVHSYRGAYGQIGAFLTREHKDMECSYDGFKSIKPVHAYGAFELAARYSFVDAEELGKQENYTAGMNWYINKNTKLAINQVFAKVESVGNFNAITARFQVDF